MPKVRLKFSPYMRGDSEWHDVEATVRGDLAVHRWGMLHGPGDLRMSKSWTVSHIPTGSSVLRAAPPRFFDRGACIARKRDLIAWAEAFQEKCPDFFKAAREGDTEYLRKWGPGYYDRGKLL